MSTERGMGKFVVWLGGIAATVIGGYLLWYLTRTPPPPPPPPPPAVTTFEGMVYSESAPVPKAMVAVELTGIAGANGPVHNVTDGNGAYRIELTGLPQNTAATLSVTAAGYQNAPPKSLASPLQADVRIDFPIAPAAAPPGTAAAAPSPPAATPAPGAATPTPAAPGSVAAAPPAQAVVGFVPLYVRKSAAQATRVRIAAKKQ